GMPPGAMPPGAGPMLPPPPDAGLGPGAQPLTPEILQMLIAAERGIDPGQMPPPEMFAPGAPV
ncbi:two-component sensor histidine kinase, partial [bacterium]|nr:two-component sensor histidine kinase [bacterium]